MRQIPQKSNIFDIDFTKYIQQITPEIKH